jgi:hypothetical protein
MTNFEKWKQNLKPEDLILDRGENTDKDEWRYVICVGYVASEEIPCKNCPAYGKCRCDYWTDCSDAFMEWANEESEC